MADAFKNEMAAAGVPETVAAAIVGAGYDCKDTFLESVVDVAALDTLATSILAGKVEGLKAENATIHPSTGKLRKWFKQVLAESAKASGPVAADAPKLAGLPIAKAKVKLDDASFQKMKTGFFAAHPHEANNSRRNPSQATLQKVVDMMAHSDGSWKPAKESFKWLAPEDFESEAAVELRREQGKSEATSRKRKLEVTEDGWEVTEVDSEVAACQKFAGSRLAFETFLELRARTFAYVGLAALGTMRQYNETLLDFHYEYFSPESKLRPPSLSELLVADKRAFTKVPEVLRKQADWSVGKAIAHAALPGSELFRMLPPRPLAPESSKGSSKGDSKTETGKDLSLIHI